MSKTIQSLYYKKCIHVENFKTTEEKNKYLLLWDDWECKIYKSDTLSRDNLFLM